MGDPNDFIPDHCMLLNHADTDFYIEHDNGTSFAEIPKLEVDYW